MRESTREIERSSRRRVDGVLVIVIYALASTVSGRRSLAHATTRAEAFWRWPIFRRVEHACQGDRRRRPADDGFERCALSLICLIGALLRQSGANRSHLPAARSSWREM